MSEHLSEAQARAVVNAYRCKAQQGVTSAVARFSKAAGNGELSTMERLLAAGVSADAKDELGVPVLHWAVCAEHPDAVRLLQRHGANLDATDADGKTALMSAVIYGKTASAEVLLECGADGGAADDDDNTALHFAACHDRLDVARLLARAGGPASGKNRSGKTALDIALERSHHGVAALLEKPPPRRKRARAEAHAEAHLVIKCPPNLTAGQQLAIEINEQTFVATIPDGVHNSINFNVHVGRGPHPAPAADVGQVVHAKWADGLFYPGVIRRNWRNDDGTWEYLVGWLDGSCHSVARAENLRLPTDTVLMVPTDTHERFMMDAPSEPSGEHLSHTEVRRAPRAVSERPLFEVIEDGDRRIVVRIVRQPGGFPARTRGKGCPAWVIKSDLLQTVEEAERAWRGRTSAGRIRRAPQPL